MDENQLVQIYVSKGWDPNSALADIRAGGWKNKEWITGGGSMGGTAIPAFNFDEKAAEQKAMAELAPYYEQVLKMYGGDVALAKQRIDQDYERGLRIQTSNADWAKDDIDIASQERKRKLNLAVKDLDQQLNARGIYDSGIKTQEQGNLQAGEAYQAGQDTRNKEEIARELSQFSEGKNIEYQREMERLGYAKPVAQTVSGQFAPNTAGQTSPIAQANVSNFTAEPIQKQVEMEEQKRRDMATKVQNERSKAYEKWASDAQRLASMSQY